MYTYAYVYIPISHTMYHTQYTIPYNVYYTIYIYIHMYDMYIYIYIMSTYIHTSCNVHVYLICRFPPHRSFIESARPFWFPQEPSGMRDFARYGGRVVGSAQIGKKVGEGWVSRVFSFYFWYMAMDQYLLIPFLVGWTSIYQLFWCSPGVQGFDTLPYLCYV